jgi:hypothetical protein
MEGRREGGKEGGKEGGCVYEANTEDITSRREEDVWK